MSNKNPKKIKSQLREKINAIGRELRKNANIPQFASPFISLTTPSAYPESSETFAQSLLEEPLDTASPAIFSAKITSSSNAEASAGSSEHTSPPIERFDIVKSYEIIRNPPPSPESPPERHPRHLGKSHSLEASQSPRKKPHPENMSFYMTGDDQLQSFVGMEMLLENAEAQNQLNETADLLQCCIDFPEELPNSPPPPSYSMDIEKAEQLVSEKLPKFKKEECIVCKQFEKLSLQKDEVHLTWLRCKFYLTSLMHDICKWDIVPAEPKPKFRLSSDSEHYQHSRQKSDVEVKNNLNVLDMAGLSTVVTMYIEKFMKLLCCHTTLEQVYAEEKCENMLKELQTEYLNLFSTRTKILKYLLYESEGFRHKQCPSFETGIKWIGECTQEILDGLREFEINIENLHLGRLIWSDEELKEK
ncbi:hypothetical protein V9T40_008412 [Parthenolecanium corni]|uniref:Uncharacterized protein n=1 Tax=Parthenolecanium corni TaxID=536013 RepID=A0AAN9TN17_9HEMI